MEQLQNPRRTNRSTIGESLIVMMVVAGFFVAFLQGKTSLQDIGALAGFLVAIVAFYMALLFCRMLFFWMTGGDQASYPWWEHQGRWQEMQKKK